MDILYLQEIWFDGNTEEFKIPGYFIVSRRDYIISAYGRGILFFCRHYFEYITDLGNFPLAECTYNIIHTDMGVILLVNWYRPLDAEFDILYNFIEEYEIYN